MQSENGGQTGPFDLSRLTRRVAWLYPLVLWFFATFFLLGDYGWWNDDYFFNQRQPTTGEYQSLILTRRQPEFEPAGHLLPWRPLHLSGTAALVTVFWDRPAVVHAVGAGIHLMCAGSLFLFLRRLRVSVHAAAGVTAVHLVHASHYEAVLWASSLVTVAAATALFLALTAMVEFGRTGRKWLGAAAPLLTVLIAGFYEQPGGCLPALALAYFAGALQRDDGKRLGRVDLLHAAWPTAASLVIMGAYALNVKYNSGPGLGAGSESYAPIMQLPARMREVLQGMGALAKARDTWLGSLSLGLSAMFEHVPRMLLFLLALGASAAAVVHAWTTTRTHGSTSAARGITASVCAMVMGVTLVLGACVPLAVINGYGGNPRTFYLVCAGAMVFFAGLADLIGLAFDRAGRLALPARLVCAIVTVCVTAVGAVMYVGMQQRYALVYRANEAQVARLVELVPEPPAHAVMLPLADYSRPFRTPQKAFDRGIASAWEYTWLNWFLVKNHYRRDDVHGLFYNQHDQFVRGVSVDEARLAWAMDTPYRAPEGSNEYVPVPLGKLVPFVIDPQGKVRVVTRWNIRPLDGGTPFSVDLPHAAALVEERRVPPFEFEWPAPAQWPMSGR